VLFEKKGKELGSATRVYCNNAECSAFISQTLSKVIELCARCVAQRHACKATAHEGDCPNDPTFKLLVETAAKEGWSQCYRCCRMIELEPGCAFMT